MHDNKEEAANVAMCSLRVLFIAFCLRLMLSMAAAAGAVKSVSRAWSFLQSQGADVTQE
jgi:hypothetical protein